MRSLGFAMIAAASLGVASASAQKPAQKPAPAKPAAAAPAKPAAPAPAPTSAVPAPAAQAPPEVYSYNPEGRRDPFVSLMIKGSEVRSRENRPEGAAGLTVGEITVRGIVKSRSTYIAMVAGPDNKTYTVHTGDKLFDGSVKAITAEEVVFSQDVNDPLSLVKQREVRKALRSTEEGK